MLLPIAFVGKVLFAVFVIGVLALIGLVSLIRGR